MKTLTWRLFLIVLWIVAFLGPVFAIMILTAQGRKP